MSGSKEHMIWQSMKDRCSNPNNKRYDLYGERGITVCDEWKNSFEQFYKDMGPKPTSKHSIDRVDVDGNYCKENCRWATDAEQSRNTRSNINITYNGKTQCLQDWANELEIPAHRIRRRMKESGATFEQAINTPLNERIKKYNQNGERSHSAKLNNIQVIEIFQSNLTYKTLSEKFLVSQWTIESIKKKKTWKEVTKDL
jgi:hypothetical protein